MARFTHPAFGGVGGLTTEIHPYTPIWNTVTSEMQFSSDPLVEGYYIKIGNLVTVQIDVLMSNVTNFGTTGYTVTLPFPSKYHADVYGGSIHQIVNQGVEHYSIKGHLTDGSNVVNIYAVSSSALDEIFDHNSPTNLHPDDRFHMFFTYMAE